MVIKGPIWQTCRLKMTMKSSPAEQPVSTPAPAAAEPAAAPSLPEPPTPPRLPPELGGRDGPEPTRFGDWEKAGRCIDF